MQKQNVWNRFQFTVTERTECLTVEDSLQIKELTLRRREEQNNAENCK